MMDEKTPHLALALPHADNLLEEDVLRLRESLAVVDNHAEQTDTALETQRTATEAALTRLEQGLSEKATTQSVENVLAEAQKAFAAATKNVAVQHSPANSRSAVIAAKANYTVPQYVVGSGRLMVWLDGLLCVAGTNAAVQQYQEIGTAQAASTIIRWHDAIAVSHDITVRVC